MSKSGPEQGPTVLIVDDEEDLREIMRRILERRGFQTLSAGTGDAAMRVCDEHPGPIDLLLADLGVAGESGGELAGRAVRQRAAMRVLYVSGLSHDAAVRQQLIGPAAPLVQKPFTADGLVTAVRAVLS